MSASTAIEWCDATFNPWWGCERVSPGCARCYADTLARRYGHADTWGAGHAFRFFGDKHWADPLKWARTMPEKLGRRPRVFCASMADVFEERPELEEPRARLVDLIYRTPELDWLLLTKRVENVGRMLGPDGVGMYAVERGPVACPQPNLWIGTSIENARFTWRATVLRHVPAAVRFISAEPLLGSLFTEPTRGATRRHADPAGRAEAPAPGQGAASPNGGQGSVEASSARANDGDQGERRNRSSAPLDLSGIDWVIVGGESGPGARPFDLGWAREIIAACRSHDVAPFVKQLGSRPIVSYEIDGHPCSASAFGIRDRKGGDWDEWGAYPDLRVREFPEASHATR